MHAVVGRISFRVVVDKIMLWRRRDGNGKEDRRQALKSR